MSSTNTDTGDIFHEVVDLGIPQVVENYAPHGLKALSGLEVEENQPLGTVVGQFIASDPEGSSLQYLMIGKRNGPLGWSIKNDGTGSPLQ